MNYPKTRLRRLRYNKNIRKLFEDININKSDLIQPIFIVEGDNIKKEIKSLKGQYQLSIDNTITFCKELIENGINSIILFGVSSKKDETGEISCSSESIIPKAIKEIKKTYDDQLLVIADVCNCSYTNHGHCGTIVNDDVDNDLTLKTLLPLATMLLYFDYLLILCLLLIPLLLIERQHHFCDLHMIIQYHLYFCIFSKPTPC